MIPLPEYSMNDAFHFDPLAVFLRGSHPLKRNGPRRGQTDMPQNSQARIAYLRRKIRGFCDTRNFHKISHSDWHIGLDDLCVDPDTAAGILHKEIRLLRVVERDDTLQPYGVALFGLSEAHLADRKCARDDGPDGVGSGFVCR